MGVPWKRDLYLPVLVSVLLLLCLPISSHDVLAKEPVADAEPTADGSEAPSFCQDVQISSTGAVCKSTYGFIARLDFPWVDLESVIAGEQFLASAETTFSVRDQMIGGKQYRNISFVLRWEPTTPAFLQVYMADLLPSWEGHGVPYRLLWRANYETCMVISCKHWTKVEDRGEYLPSEIPGLPEELAANSNFNDVPASFWNTNLVNR